MAETSLIDKQIRLAGRIRTFVKVLNSKCKEAQEIGLGVVLEHESIETMGIVNKRIYTVVSIYREV